MLDPTIRKLLRDNRRYPWEAYVFVFEALNYAQNVLGYGVEAASEPFEPPLAASEEGDDAGECDCPPELAELTDGAIQDLEEKDPAEELGHRHVTGRELCEAIRLFALEQYGYMAKTVLNQWGIRATGDFGEMVFNLIRIGQMRKTPADRRKDFDDVYDFNTAFRQGFRFGTSQEEA